MSYIAKIHEFKGKQELYFQQKPAELERLVEIAKVESTESSNRIEVNAIDLRFLHCPVCGGVAFFILYVH